MRPRRILYIEVNEDGTVGGSHQALYDLARNLDRSRYEPVVLFYQENRFAKLLREEGIETFVYDEVRARERAVQFNASLPVKRLAALKTILARRRFLREHRIDAVHVNNHPYIGCDDWLPACRLLRLPIVATVMGDRTGISGPLRQWLMARFDRILPISEYITRSIVARGLPEDRMTEIYLGVDTQEIRDRVARDRAAVRSELGLSEGQLLLVMAGNIRAWKGQDVLLSALSGLSEAERDRVHVAFAGARDEESLTYQEDLHRMERELDLSDHVSWLGFREDIPDLFAAADLAVHCSVIPEPFGLVVVEAMALGTPVAATDFGGPAEIVTPASGWLYDASKPEELTEILRSAVTDPESLAERGANAVERAEKFTVARNVAANVGVYDQLFGS